MTLAMVFVRRLNYVFTQIAGRRPLWNILGYEKSFRVQRNELHEQFHSALLIEFDPEAFQNDFV